MVINAKSMQELTEYSKLQKILLAIKERAEGGYNNLNLYGFNTKGIRYNKFIYGEQELAELRKLGFTVTASSDINNYDQYHSISW